VFDSLYYASIRAAAACDSRLLYADYYYGLELSDSELSGLIGYGDSVLLRLTESAESVRYYELLMRGVSWWGYCSVVGFGDQSVSFEVVYASLRIVDPLLSVDSVVWSGVDEMLLLRWMFAGDSGVRMTDIHPLVGVSDRALWKRELSMYDRDYRRYREKLSLRRANRIISGGEVGLAVDLMPSNKMFYVSHDRVELWG
jgi:hypothetical protein